MENQQYKINQELSQRLSIIKFIFMVMVVFIHSDALPELPYAVEIPKYVEICKDIVTDGICSVAIPGFFLISGFFLFSKEFTWLGNMKKKAKSILLPYFIINTFWILFFKVMQSISLAAAYFSGEAYQINGLKGIIGAYLNPIPLYYPFWFLHDLFLLNIVANGIKWLIDKFPIIFIVIIIAVQLGFIHLPFLVSKDSFCMFAISYYIVKYKFDFKRLDKIHSGVVGVFFLLLILVKLYIWQHTIIPFLHIATGILFFYLLTGFLCQWKVASKLVWCSQFTFFIYAFHEFYEAMLKKVIMMVIPQYGIIQLLEYFLIPVCMVGICLVAGAFLKRKVPVIYKTICGFR